MADITNQGEYEKTIECFRRLIQYDDSNEFKLKIKQSDHHDCTINLSTNKARIISKKINEIHQIDPTIDSFEIFIDNEEEIATYEEIFNKILKSIDGKISIDKEKRKQFSQALFLLGEDETELVNNIINIKESISLLNTKFHTKSIEYISNHFTEFIESGFATNISQNILIEIIEYYFFIHKDKDAQENEKIFKLIQQQNNDEITMIFLIHTDYKCFSFEMKKYFYEHLNDELIEKFFSEILFHIKQHFLCSKQN